MDVLTLFLSLLLQAILPAVCSYLSINVASTIFAFVLHLTSTIPLSPPHPALDDVCYP